jgi:hypothetical protein
MKRPERGFFVFTSVESLLLQTSGNKNERNGAPVLFYLQLHVKLLTFDPYDIIDYHCLMTLISLFTLINLIVE